MNHTTLTTTLRLRSTGKLRMTRNRILLSLLMIAGSVQPIKAEYDYCDSDCYSYDYSDYVEYDYEADDIAICQSILKYDIEFLKSLIVPGNEMAAIKLLAPKIDFNQYCIEYFESTTFLHLLSGLLDQDEIATLQSNFNENEVAQYTSKVLDLMKHAIEIGIDINATNSWGETALSGAVEYGAFDAAMLLIQSGANVNLADEEGITPLFLAVQNSFDQYDDHCYFTSEDETSKPFVMTSNVPMVKALLAAGAQTSITLDGQNYEFLKLLDEVITDVNYELHGWDADPSLFILKDELVAIKAILQS